MALREAALSMSIPQSPGFDHTLAFLREGYDFVSNRCQALNTDIFSARLALRKVICMRGAPAGIPLLLDSHADGTRPLLTRSSSNLAGRGGRTSLPAP
jgi:hypothetical protein